MTVPEKSANPSSHRGGNRRVCSACRKCRFSIISIRDDGVETRERDVVWKKREEGNLRERKREEGGG